MNVWMDAWRRVVLRRWDAGLADTRCGLRQWRQRVRLGLLLPLLTLALGSAQALTLEQAQAVVEGDTDARLAAVQSLVVSGDAPGQALVSALAAERVMTVGERVFLVRADDRLQDAVSGDVIDWPGDAQEVRINNRMRGALAVAVAGMDVLTAAAPRQREAARTLQREAFDSPQDAPVAVIERAMQRADLDADARQYLSLALAAIRLSDPDVAQRLRAAQGLGEARLAMVRPLLQARAAAEPDATVQAALRASLASVDRSLALNRSLAELFTGLSLGSILLLAALGLAITYGLMGVINMAHGELIMLGAYATWLVQRGFQLWAPQWFDAYLWVAMPVAFGVSAVVGALMERLVIRHLYGRALETLLATWGISLVLMQAVRSLFGAQNVGVENPSWMSGSLTLMGSLNLPWNRVLIVAFAALVLLGVSLLIARTRLGLFVRGVTQNRPMAACMGVNTARIDTYAFALGAGVAGLAGCALSQIGNVGPDLGQNYIVDSFMVVVLGGVGQLAGTVYAALGLGVLNKFIEGWAGAVLAKIAVLIFIIVFIQKRPQGIFAMKGRSAEA